MPRSIRWLFVLSYLDWPKTQIEGRTLRGPGRRKISMSSRAFKRALTKEAPILFVNIGWAVRYDGTETIVGNHRYIRQNPGERVGESRAFIAKNGFCQCAIGYGATPSEPIHIVFLARDPS